MNMLTVFTPKRFVRLFASDAKNVGRDPTLLFAILFSLAPALAFALAHGQLDTLGETVFGLDGFSRYALPFAISLPAFLVGWVTGFLFLEDRDDGPLLAIDITPLGKGGFIGYRVAVTALITVLVTLFGIWLIVPAAGPWLALLLAALVAMEAVSAAFILPAAARNKVEGLAITKLTNIAALAPVLAVIPSPWRYLGGVVPSYWVGELLQLSDVNYLPVPVVAALAIVIHAGAVALLYQLMLRRVG